VDGLSLYPYICKYDKFPSGPPKVNVGEECRPDCLDRDGIIKRKVLPSRKLYDIFFRIEATSNYIVFYLCLQLMKEI